MAGFAYPGQVAPAQIYPSPVSASVPLPVMTATATTGTLAYLINAVPALRAQARFLVAAWRLTAGPGVMNLLAQGRRLTVIARPDERRIE